MPRSFSRAASRSATGPGTSTTPGRRGARFGSGTVTVVNDAPTSFPSGTNLVVISFQVQRFKAVNDQHGYETGDRLLKSIANALLDEAPVASMLSASVIGTMGTGFLQNDPCWRSLGKLPPGGALAARDVASVKTGFLQRQGLVRSLEGHQGTVSWVSWTRDGAHNAAVAGVASFSGLSIDKIGTGYTLTAADGSLTGTTSGSFNISPAAARSPRKENWRKPSTSLMMPITGSTVHLRAP